MMRARPCCLMILLAIVSSVAAPLVAGEATPEPAVAAPKPAPGGEPTAPKVDKRPTEPLSLQRAMLLALRRNLRLAAAKLGPGRAATVVVEELAAFDPSAFTNFDRRKANLQVRSIIFGNREQNWNSKVGLRKPFRLGTTAEVFAGWEKDWDDSTFAAVNPAYSQEYGLALSQPLLRGFGIRVNTAAIATARNERRMVLAALRDVAIQTVAETTRTYWELVFAIGNRKFLLESLEQARNLQRDVTARVDARVLGARDPSVAQATAGVAIGEEAVVIAADAIHDTEDALKVLTDLVAEPALWYAAIVPTSLPPATAPPLDPEQSVQIALDKRPDYHQLKIAIENNDIDILVRHNELLPWLNLTVKATSIGLGAGWGVSGHDARSADFYDMSFGLALEYPLGNRAARARHRRAKLEREQTVLNQKALEQRIQFEVRQAVRQVATNLERLRTASVTVAAERERLRAENIRFKEARVGTTQDVLDAVAALANAQRRRLRALVDLNQSLVDVERFQGTLLEAHQLTLEDDPTLR